MTLPGHLFAESDNDSGRRPTPPGVGHAGRRLCPEDNPEAVGREHREGKARHVTPYRIGVIELTCRLGMDQGGPWTCLTVAQLRDPQPGRHRGPRISDRFADLRPSHR